MTDVKTETKFFRQPGPKIDPLAIEKGAITSELSALADDNGLIRVQLDAEAVLPRIANGIYANFESGFRETYANAITACLNAKEVFKADPRIEITYDVQNRLLEVAEIDSTGITYGMFKDVYVVVGRSGNFDATKPGQFGFGRLAWTTLSDRMILKTKYRNSSGQTGCFAVEGKNGMAFAILPTPDLEYYGTTVSMVVYEKIDPLRLIAYIKQACRLSPVDTFLTLSDGEKKERTKLNDTYENVMTDQNRFINDSTYRSDYNQYNYSEVITFKLPGFDVYALNITYRAKTDMTSIPSTESGITRAVLLNLPVYTNLRLPFSRALICITDERAFPPTADRERLKEETEAQIQSKLWPVLTQYFSKYVVHNVSQFTKLDVVDRAVLLSFSRRRNGWTTNDGRTLLDRETDEFITTLSFNVDVKGISERRRIQRLELAVMLTEFTTDELFIEDSNYTSRHLKLLRQVYPRAILIMGKDYQQIEVQNVISQLNLRSATQYITENNLKLPRPPRTARGYTIHRSKHRSGYSFADETQTFSDAKDITIDNLIKVGRKDSVTKYSELLESFPTKYTVTSATNIKGGEALDDFISRVEATTQVTNKGPMAVKEFLKYDSIFLTMHDNPAIAPLVYPNDTRLVVIDNVDRLFEIAMYLTKNGKAYVSRLDPSDEFEAITGKKPYKFYSGYSSLNDRANILWTLLRIYAAAKDKNVAYLLMRGVGQSSTEEFPESTELALKIASQDLPTNQKRK
ncbi:MAG: hypothetical protein JRN21_09515 [Nitrososphaerota archaeon]|nr:hypothetical protein [Nitrososphaerota archaeon]